MDATTIADAATAAALAATAVFGSSYCSSSAATVPVSVLAADADAITDAVMAAAAAGPTITAEMAVAANLFGNGLEGIFGCPSCLGNDNSLTTTLKLFLPYFPLHIQKLISMYLKLIEMMHTFEMIRNMMNHMDEYQALFQMFEGMSEDSANPLSAMTPIFGNFGGSNFSMPDLNSMQKMMEGSDLVDEFTYVEEPSRTGWNGS